MAETPSNMIPLGTMATDFTLLDTVSGNMVTLKDKKSEVATVIAFICNHCPFVKHINIGFSSLSREYTEKGIQFIGISSNDIVGYPEDAPDKMKDVALKENYVFPYLYDETQNIAKAYSAACTPDFFIFDGALKLVYRGQMDPSRPGNDIPVSGKDLRLALDNIISGEMVSIDQKPSLGCNIKWKA